jgi:hypothetical protein
MRRTYPSVARPERAMALRDVFNGWVGGRNEDGVDNGARGGWHECRERSPMCPKGRGVMRPWSGVAREPAVVTAAIKSVDERCCWYW